MMKPLLTVDQMTLKMWKSEARRTMIAMARVEIAQRTGRSPFDASVRAEAARQVGR